MIRLPLAFRCARPEAARPLRPDAARRGLALAVGMLVAASAARAQVPVVARVSAPAAGWEAPAVGDYVTVRVHVGRADAASPLRFAGLAVYYDPTAYTRVSQSTGPLTRGRDFDDSDGSSEGLLFLRHDPNIGGSGRGAFSYAYSLFDGAPPISVDGRVAFTAVLRVRAALPAARYAVTVEEVELRDAASALVPAAPGVVVEDRPVSGSAAGWRLVSVPAAGASVATLAALNLVQGVPGEFAGATPNLYTGYTGREAGPSRGFTVPGATTDALVPGRGSLWYLFASGGPEAGDTRGVSRRAPLPMPFAAPGVPPSDSLAVSFTAAERDGATDGFYLLGNPFPWAYDLSGIRTSAGTLSDIFQVYDAATGWKTLQRTDGPLSLSDANPLDDIAAWQGVFAEVTGAGGAPFVPSAGVPLTVTFRSAAAAAAPAYVGKAAAMSGAGAAGARLAFSLSGTLAGKRLADEGAALYAAADAGLDWDRFDASKLDPLVAVSVALALGGPRGGTAAWLAQRSLPDALDAPLTIPLRLSLPAPMRLALAWTGAELPFDVALVDAGSGARTDLRAAAAYAFDAAPGDSLRLSLRLAPRVTPLTVDLHSTAFDVSVSAVAPNPATDGAAHLYVRAGQDDRVSVAVYDVLGRRVATMGDVVASAGVSQRVDLPVGALGAGVYVVRVTGARGAATRTLTVLR